MFTKAYKTTNPHNMKRTLISLVALCLATISMNGQNAYVCHGYGYDTYTIADIGDMTFSADQTTVNIAGETYEVADIDSITFSEPQFPMITIEYNGTTATVNIPAGITGVTCSSGTSSHVVITSTNTTTEYMYSLSGTSSDGSFTLNGSYKLTMQLNGVKLISRQGAAIDIECGKRIDCIVKEGTVNTLTDSSSGDQKAAFYTKGHIEFKGGGILNVKGNLKHAIAAKEYLIIKGSFGTLNVLSAVSDGIHCGRGDKGSEHNYFQMNGGTVNIGSCGSDCIDSDDYGCIKIKDGTLKLNITATDGTGLKCDSIFTMSGGNIILNITGAASEGICTSYTGNFKGGTISGTLSADGARGIRGKNVTKVTGTVRSGGNLNFSGTNVNLTVSGGTDTSTSNKAFGIKADKTLTQTAGDITINVTNSAAADIYAATDTWTGGTRNGASK